MLFSPLSFQVYEAVVTNVASGQRAFLRIVRRVAPVSEETGAAAKDDGGAKAPRDPRGAKGVEAPPARSLNIAVTVHISRISRSLRVGEEPRTRSPAIGEILALGASVLVTPLPVGSESTFAATHVTGNLLREVAVLAGPGEAAAAVADAQPLDRRFKSPLASSPHHPSLGSSASPQASASPQSSSSRREDDMGDLEPSRAFGFEEKYWPRGPSLGSERGACGSERGVADGGRGGEARTERRASGRKGEKREETELAAEPALPPAAVGLEVDARAIRVEEGYAILKLACAAPQALFSLSSSAASGDREGGDAPHAASDSPWGFLHWSSVRFRFPGAAGRREPAREFADEAISRGTSNTPQKRIDLRQLMTVGELVRVRLKAPPSDTSPRWQVLFTCPTSSPSSPSSSSSPSSPSSSSSPSSPSSSSSSSREEGAMGQLAVGGRSQDEGDEHAFVDEMREAEERQPASAEFFLDDEGGPPDASLAYSSRGRRRGGHSRQPAKQREDEEESFPRKARHRPRRSASAQEGDLHPRDLSDVRSKMHMQLGPAALSSSSSVEAASAAADDVDEGEVDDEELWLLREEAKLLARLREAGVEAAETKKEESSRPAVVCILGHIDHGKTTLLRALKLKGLLRLQAPLERRCAAQSEREKGRKARRGPEDERLAAVEDERLQARKRAILSAAVEAGGITQRLSAFQLSCAESSSSSASPFASSVTFLDTPGHAAFEQMRERAASGADLAVLVVAVDEGVQPQTARSIQMCRAANIPFVVALTKRTRLSLSSSCASPSSVSGSSESLLSSPPVLRVLSQLAEHGAVTEPLGGDVQVALVDAKSFLDSFSEKRTRKKQHLAPTLRQARLDAKPQPASPLEGSAQLKSNRPQRRDDKVEGEGDEREEDREEEAEEAEEAEGEEERADDLDDLIEKIFFQAELLELKTSLTCPGEGLVMEAFVAKGVGGCASILLKRGSVRKGATVLAGPSVCRVRRLRLRGSGDGDTETGRAALLRAAASASGPRRKKGERALVLKNAQTEKELQERSRPACSEGKSGTEEIEVDAAFAGEIVDVCGFPSNNLPLPGETFVVINSDADGRQLAELNRRKRQRAEELRRAREAKMRVLDRLLHGEDEDLTLPVVIKADQQGTAEALASALASLWAPAPNAPAPTAVAPSVSAASLVGPSPGVGESAETPAAEPPVSQTPQKETVSSETEPDAVAQAIRDTWTRRIEYDEGLDHRKRGSGDVKEDTTHAETGGPLQDASSHEERQLSAVSPSAFTPRSGTSLGYGASVSEGDTTHGGARAASSSSPASSAHASSEDVLAKKEETGEVPLETRGSGRRSVQVLCAKAGLLSIEDVQAVAVSRTKSRSGTETQPKRSQPGAGVVIAFATPVSRQVKDEVARQGATLVTADVIYDVVSEVERILMRENLFFPDDEETGGQAANNRVLSAGAGRRKKTREQREGVAGKADELKPYTGKASVKALFHLKSGLVAGCSVDEGEVTLGALVQVTRDGRLLFEGSLVSLRVGPDAQTTVRGPGTECGVMLDGVVSDLAVGDVLHCSPPCQDGKKK
ncbi:UNVERIFIED_CONTAM: elongation factor Tu GTP binding domain-containing protein [Hammondia hammondi]|eukprot:XP_008882181.1 elongation factor Tu GTP binding domain-containing protein [Hammondia hammondi]